MKACLNQDTLRTTPTDRFLDIAAQTGFEAIELTFDKVEAAQKADQLGSIKSRLEKSGLAVASINGPENFNLLSKQEFTALLEQAKHLASAARQLGCRLLIPVPSFRTAPKSEIVTEAAQALREITNVCGDDINLGLEFLGLSGCSVNNLAEADRIVENVGRNNVGLVIDSFHTYASQTDFSEIAKISPGRIFLAHVNDSESGDPKKLTDAQRLIPGQGVINLKAFQANLESAGYDSYLSLELLRPSYWESDPVEIARQGRDSLKRIFGI